MIPTDLAAYVPGVIAVIAFGYAGWAAERLFRRFRPETAKCVRCRGTDDLAVVIRVSNGEYAAHADCFPHLAVQLDAPYAGNWRDLELIADDIEAREEEETHS